MIRTGNLCKWPSTSDKQFYELGDIVQVISPPEVAGSRGQFREICVTAGQFRGDGRTVRTLVFGVYKI